MYGDRAQRLALYEDMHVVLTQRDRSLEQAEAAERRAEDLAVEVASLERANASLKRQVEEYQAVHVRLNERLGEARKPKPETVKVGGAL